MESIYTFLFFYYHSQSLPVGVVLVERQEVFPFRKIKPPPPLWLNRVKWNSFIHFHCFQECVNQLLYSGYHLHSPSLHHHCHHRKYHQCDIQNGDKFYDVTNLSLSLRPDIDSSVSYLDDEKIKEIACFRVENGQLLQAVRNISHVNMELSEVR